MSRVARGDARTRRRLDRPRARSRRPAAAQRARQRDRRAAFDAGAADAAASSCSSACARISMRADRRLPTWRSSGLNMCASMSSVELRGVARRRGGARSSCARRTRALPASSDWRARRPRLELPPQAASIGPVRAVRAHRRRRSRACARGGRGIPAWRRRHRPLPGSFGRACVREPGVLNMKARFGPMAALQMLAIQRRIAALCAASPRIHRFHHVSIPPGWCTSRRRVIAENTMPLTLAQPRRPPLRRPARRSAHADPGARRPNGPTTTTPTGASR